MYAFRSAIAAVVVGCAMSQPVEAVRVGFMRGLGNKSPHASLDSPTEIDADLSNLMKSPRLRSSVKAKAEKLREYSKDYAEELTEFTSKPNALAEVCPDPDVAADFASLMYRFDGMDDEVIMKIDAILNEEMIKRGLAIKDVKFSDSKVIKSLLHDSYYLRLGERLITIAERVDRPLLKLGVKPDKIAEALFEIEARRELTATEKDDFDDFSDEVRLILDRDVPRSGSLLARAVRLLLSLGNKNT